MVRDISVASWVLLQVKDLNMVSLDLLFANDRSVVLLDILAVAVLLLLVVDKDGRARDSRRGSGVQGEALKSAELK